MDNVSGKIVDGLWSNVTARILAPTRRPLDEVNVRDDIQGRVMSTIGVSVCDSVMSVMKLGISR
jgi:hypothetical protein